MKTVRPFAVVAASLVLSPLASRGSLIITGVIDGTLGGLPTATVITATAPIANLSTYGLATSFNGAGSAQRVTFSGSIEAGQTIVVAANSESVAFFANNYTDSFSFYSSTLASINGDDAVEIFLNGSPIDTYGDPSADGTGESWEYLNGYAVRTGGVAGAFDQGNYNTVLGGFNGLDEAQHASLIGSAFGFTQVPEPSVALLGALGLVGLLRRRR